MKKVARKVNKRWKEGEGKVNDWRTRRTEKVPPAASHEVMDLQRTPGEWRCCISQHCTSGRSPLLYVSIRTSSPFNFASIITHFPYIITLGFRLPSPFVCVRHHPSLALTITFLIPHHLSYVYHRILFMKTIGVPSQSVPEGSWDLSRVIMINKVTILANTYTPI